MSSPDDGDPAHTYDEVVEMPAANTLDEEEPAPAACDEVIKLPNANSSEDPEEPTTAYDNLMVVIPHAPPPLVNRMAVKTSIRVPYNPNDLHNTGPLRKKMLEYGEEHFVDGDWYQTVRITALGNQALREHCRADEQKTVCRFPSYSLFAKDLSLLSRYKLVDTHTSMLC